MCVCIFCIVTLEPLSTLCVSFFGFFLIYIFIVESIYISVYIMCVIPCSCLFSALSHRVGALQISMIIIIIVPSLLILIISYHLCFFRQISAACSLSPMTVMPGPWPPCTLQAPTTPRTGGLQSSSGHICHDDDITTIVDWALKSSLS